MNKIDTPSWWREWSSRKDWTIEKIVGLILLFLLGICACALFTCNDDVPPPPESTGGHDNARKGSIPLDIWISYSDWRKRENLFQSAEAFEGDDELQSLRALLGYAFINCSDIRAYKPRHPVIETLVLVYRSADSGRRMIKFQRIHGRDSSGRPAIYFNAESSSPDGNPRFALFSKIAPKTWLTNPIRSGSDRQTPAQWVRLEFPGRHQGPRDFDCLTVGYYPKGNPRHGDDFWVDVPMYTQDSADVYLSVLSQEDFDVRSEAVSFWEMSSSLPFLIGAEPVLQYNANAGQVITYCVQMRYINANRQELGQVPLRFRRLNHRGMESVWKDPNPRIASIRDWMTKLDEYRAEYSRNASDSLNGRTGGSIPPAYRLLELILTDLHRSLAAAPASFSSLLSSRDWRAFRAYYVPATPHSVAMIMNWQTDGEVR